jgi:membrane associated rhomboid family serine protease
MIPIRDTVRPKHTAWIVRLLVAANLAMFWAEIAQGPALEPFVYQFGVVPAFWHATSVWDLGRWGQLLVTLVSSQFLHGGLLHLLSNMLYLWIFGDNIEDRLGPVRFLLLYLVSGMLAALAQLTMNPHSVVPMIGASGAIAGVLGAYLMFFPSARILTLMPWLALQFVEVPAFLFLGLWFFLQWLQGMTTIGQVAATGGVAWWAHVAGFLSGMVFGPRLAPRQRYF